MRCYVYPAKKKRTISTSLLRKIPSLLIGVFGLTCRPVPPRAAQPGYLPVPATAGAVPPGPPGRASPVPVPSAPPADGPPEDPAWPVSYTHLDVYKIQVLHRLTGDGNRNELIEPSWSMDKRGVLNEIHKKMRQRNSYQGKLLK